MPKITEVHLIEITPEKFLESCSPKELYELDLLLNREQYQVMIALARDGRFKPKPADYPDIKDVTDPNLLTCH